MCLDASLVGEPFDRASWPRVPGDGAEDVIGVGRRWLLRRIGPDLAVLTLTPTRDQADRHGEGHIRCPRCEWHPRPSSRWCCSECPRPEGFFEGCGTLWNTFETSGICPGCRHRWVWTSCLSCGGWSLHDDWYVQEDRE